MFPITCLENLERGTSMNGHPFKRTAEIAALLALLACGVSPVYAQPHERYATDHFVYDDRFHHDHFYPRTGYVVHALPPGHAVVAFRGGSYYFHGGVWYQPSGPGFIVVRPPVGIVVTALPPAYVTVWAAGAPYYYANDVYYAQAPGGYAVVDPPAGMAEAPQAQTASPPAPPPQAPAAAPVAAAAAAGTWYFCDSSKTYYPYVTECKEGWRSVPATPTPGR
jgi:Family of unknown function (DUF6515)